jgi:hypothetical protein
MAAAIGLIGASIAGAAGQAIGDLITPGNIAACGRGIGRGIKSLISLIANDDSMPVPTGVALDLAQLSITFNMLNTVVNGRSALPESSAEWGRMTRKEARERLTNAMNTLQVGNQRFAKEMLGDKKDAVVQAAAIRVDEMGRTNLMHDMMEDMSFSTNPEKAPEDQHSAKRKGMSGNGKILSALDVLLESEPSLEHENPGDIFASTPPMSSITICSDPGGGTPDPALGSIKNLNVDGQNMGEFGLAARTEFADNAQTAYDIFERSKSRPQDLLVRLEGAISLEDVGGQLWNGTSLVPAARSEQVFKGSVAVTDKTADAGAESTGTVDFGKLEFAAVQDVTRSGVSVVQQSLEFRESLYMSIKGTEDNNDEPKNWITKTKPVNALGIVCKSSVSQDSFVDAVSQDRSSLEAKVIGVVPFSFHVSAIMPGFDAITPVIGLDGINYSSAHYTGTWNYSAETKANESIFAVVLLNPASPALDGVSGLYTTASGATRTAHEIPNFVGPPGLYVTPRISPTDTPYVRERTREGANGFVTDSSCSWTQKLTPGARGNFSYMEVQSDGSAVWKDLNDSLADIAGHWQSEGVGLTKEGVARASIGLGTVRELVISSAPKHELWAMLAKYASSALKKKIPLSYLEFVRDHADAETVSKLREIVMSGAAWISA